MHSIERELWTFVEYSPSDRIRVNVFLFHLSGVRMWITTLAFYVTLFRKYSNFRIEIEHVAGEVLNQAGSLPAFSLDWKCEGPCCRSVLDLRESFSRFSSMYSIERESWTFAEDSPSDRIRVNVFLFHLSGVRMWITSFCFLRHSFPKIP